MSFTLPPLKYAYTALEPYVDTATMEIHHTKHHQAYINNINNYINSEAGASLKGKSIIEIVKTATAPAVRNNGGGHYNHTLFWTWMAPAGTAGTGPTGELKAKIEEAFGSVDAMKEKFNAAALTRFGSGWAWLGVTADGKIAVTSSANQDNPLMPNSEVPLIPILGLDVWEHAYYLQYQNRRPEYISAFWNVVNWDKVNEYYTNYASKGEAVPI
ncbi:manganese superoxide dismutase [Achlya hypogyna]|uniref:Superoxide dismutase n=1 Tax=Achlya hypogyna TaxID=1202772 RepID=A0A1V9YDF3_ACHHY|nr:manganese superoxide dismutase [Achlya hypogyna]